MVVASVYLPIDTAPPTKELEQLVMHCESKNLPLVTACDSNSHHTAWGSSECNARGIPLATTGLEIANIGAEPTFVAGNKRTVIDITLASGSLMQDIHAWEVSKEDTMSDHRRINFLLEQDKPASRHCRNPRRTNWEVFDKALNQSIGLWISKVKSPADIERESMKVNSALINAYEKACPLRKVRGRHRVP